MRLGVLQNVVAPTRHALFRALARRPDVELTVLFMARTEPTRGWREAAALDYPHVFLPGVHLRLSARGEVEAFHLNPTVGRAIRRGRFDALLCAGYLSPSTWLALASCKRAGTRFLLWFGSSWPPSGARARLAGPLKRRLIGASDGVVAYGSLARERLLELGADERRVRIALNTTDVEAFAAARAARADSGPVALWVGRFVPRKRAERAVVLLARIAERVPGLRAVFVGDGPERVAAESLARRLGLAARFLGDLQYEQLPPVYAAADLLVALYEREPWGLVVNEALAAGLPVLATPGVAAARELVPAGAGAVSESEDELVAAGARLLSSPDALAAARAAARAVLPGMLPESWAEQVVAAAEAAQARQSR